MSIEKKMVKIRHLHLVMFFSIQNLCLKTQEMKQNIQNCVLLNTNNFYILTKAKEVSHHAQKVILFVNQSKKFDS